MAEKTAAPHPTVRMMQHPLIAGFPIVDDGVSEVTHLVLVTNVPHSDNIAGRERPGEVHMLDDMAECAQNVVATRWERCQSTGAHQPREKTINPFFPPTILCWRFEIQ
eukprot:395384-Amphidinium_carterae.1